MSFFFQIVYSRTRMAKKKKKNENEANQNRMLKKKKRIMGFDHGTDRDGRVYR